MGIPNDEPTPVNGEEGFTALSTSISAGGDATAVIEVAKQSVYPEVVDPDTLYVVRGADGAMHPLDLERYKDQPDRPRGEYRASTVASFIAYVKRFAKVDKSTVWVHPTDGTVTAILDDNSPDATAWREHLTTLKLIVTPEWEFWLEHNGHMLDQQTFAEKIEDGLEDVVDPVGAKMLEIAQSIQTTNNVNFRSGFELGSGEVRFAYDEKIEAKAGQKGDLVVPQEFELGIAPFVGEEAYKIRARFRFRVSGGNLKLGYKLNQPELAQRTVIESIGERIGAELTGVPVLVGTPPAGNGRRS